MIDLTHFLNLKNISISDRDFILNHIKNASELLTDLDDLSLTREFFFRINNLCMDGDYSLAMLKTRLSSCPVSAEVYEYLAKLQNELDGLNALVIEHGYMSDTQQIYQYALRLSDATVGLQESMACISLEVDRVLAGELIDNINQFLSLNKDMHALIDFTETVNTYMLTSGAMIIKLFSNKIAFSSDTDRLYFYQMLKATNIIIRDIYVHISSMSKQIADKHVQAITQAASSSNDHEGTIASMTSVPARVASPVHDRITAIQEEAKLSPASLFASKHPLVHQNMLRVPTPIDENQTNANRGVNIGPYGATF